MSTEEITPPDGPHPDTTIEQLMNGLWGAMTEARTMGDMVAFKDSRFLFDWVKEHGELVKTMLKYTRSYWSRKGVVLYQLGTPEEIAPILDELGQPDTGEEIILADLPIVFHFTPTN